MNNHSNHTRSDLIRIHLPVVTDMELCQAEDQLELLHWNYPMPPATSLQILRHHLRIFDRLVRIDPVLRRPPLQRDRPFLTTAHCPTKQEAKLLLKHIHARFDEVRMPYQERRTYLLALKIEALRVYARVQAEAEFQVLHPTTQ